MNWLRTLYEKLKNSWHGPAHIDGEWEEAMADLVATVMKQESSRSKWDRDFIAMAQFWAERKSKDPSTKCGAVITRGRKIVSLGYNGFPQKVEDSPERYADRSVKLQMVAHSEANAIVFAGGDLTGCTLYLWPFQSCSNCAALVINSGITRVVAPALPADKKARWGENMSLAATMFEEAGVKLELIDV